MAGRSFTFLGTGTSVGVPMVGCTCAVCTSRDPRNHRYRTSVLIRTPQGNILIDTPPELRLQLLREKVQAIHAVLLTHYHADHVFGLDDVRPLCKTLGTSMPLYCNEETEEVIRRAFAYAFRDETRQLPLGYIPKLAFQRIGTGPFTAVGQRIMPVPLDHAHFKVLGFRFDDVAYCTDVNHIPENSYPLLQGLRVLVLDALRHKPHAGHFSISEALDVIATLKPQRAYLTHMSHEVDHESTSRQLPPNVELAYDGLSFDF